MPSTLPFTLRLPLTSADPLALGMAILCSLPISRAPKPLSAQRFVQFVHSNPATSAASSPDGVVAKS